MPGGSILREPRHRRIPPILDQSPTLTDAVFAIPGDLATPTGGYGYDRRVLELMTSYGIGARALTLPASFPSPSSADLAETERLLTGVKPDTVLMVDGLAFAVLPDSLLQRLASKRIIALVHHPLCLESGLDAARRVALKASETAALRYAHHVIVTSRATLRTLVADFGVPEKRITVAEPGTDPALRASGTGTPLQLLAVGAVSPRKAYDVLVTALEPLADLDWRLTIAGALDRNAKAVAALQSQIAHSPRRTGRCAVRRYVRLPAGARRTLTRRQPASARSTRGRSVGAGAMASAVANSSGVP